MQEIEVTITPEGKVTIHVIGVKGEDCLALTEDLERALGGDVEDRLMTAEAYEQATNDDQTGHLLAGW